LKQGRVEVHEIDAFNQFLDDASAFVYCTTWFDFPETLTPLQIGLMRRELRRRPLDPQAAAVVIDALRYAEAWEEADRALDLALKQAPDARILWEHKAGLAAPESERQKVLSEMIRRWPEEPEFRRLLAESFLDTRQSTEALAVAEAASKAATDDDAKIQAWILAARARIAGGKLTEALGDLQRAGTVDVDETYADTLSALRGAVYARQGKLGEADEMFDLALAINPDHAEALAGAIDVAWRLDEDRAYARTLLRRLVSIAETAPEHLALAARACLNAERYDDAGDLAELALDEFAEDGEAAAVLILVRHHAKQYREVLEVPYETVESPDALAALLEASLILNRRDVAGEIAARARKIIEQAPAGGAVEALRKQLARFEDSAP
jgi:tetratricopeptide (TPR) repeat protein